MTSSERLTRILLARGNVRDAALGFITRSYFRQFGTLPADDFEYIFVAMREGEIVGTFATNFWKEARPLRLSRIHGFIYETAPLPVTPALTIEFGRWAVKVPRVSVGLIYRATLHAFEHGRTIGWCEHTLPVHRTAQSLGLKFHKVTSTINIDEVSESDRAFYTGDAAVTLYMISLEHIIDVLGERLKQDADLVIE